VFCITAARVLHMSPSRVKRRKKAKGLLSIKIDRRWCCRPYTELWYSTLHSACDQIQNLQNCLITPRQKPIGGGLKQIKSFSRLLSRRRGFALSSRVYCNLSTVLDFILSFHPSPPPPFLVLSPVSLGTTYTYPVPSFVATCYYSMTPREIHLQKGLRGDYRERQRDRDWTEL
jgi:hypothetical protein